MTTIDLGLAFFYSVFALIFAVPVGLGAAFLSLGAALGIRRILLRLTHSRAVAGFAGGLVVIAVGASLTGLLTQAVFTDLEPFAWLAYAASVVGGAAFTLWALLCAYPVRANM